MKKVVRHEQFICVTLEVIKIKVKHLQICNGNKHLQNIIIIILLEKKTFIQKKTKQKT